MFIIGLCAVIIPVLSLPNLSLPIEVAPVIRQQCSALPSFNNVVRQILHILDNVTITTNTTVLSSLDETVTQIPPIADDSTSTTETVDLHRLSRCSCAGNDSWTRVSYLDMSNSTFQCPSNWTLLETPIRGCKSKYKSGCYSAIFTVGGSMYNKVCGKIIGYQEGTTGAFHPSIPSPKTIEQTYVDGLSLTHGPPGSRKHIWTFAAGMFEDGSIYIPQYNCACTNTKHHWAYSTPSFITNNYFCDTGNPGPSYNTRGIIFSNNPLWDGSGCGSHSTCCQFNNPPWFCTSLLQPTTDDLELRICLNEYSNDENIIISSVELYISYD